MNQAAADLSRRRFLSGRTTASALCWTRQGAIADVTGAVMWDVAMRDRDNILVVGDDGIVFRYSDGGWQREDPKTRLPLHAVCLTADGDAVAVGWLGCVCEYRVGEWAQVLGARSTTPPRPCVSIEETPLFDVCVDREGDVWAVGDHGRIIRRTHGQWSECDSGVHENLRAVTALADGRVLAAGANGVAIAGGREGWQCCNTGNDATITGFASVGDDMVFAVGSRYNGAAGSFEGRLLGFDGKDWVQFDLPARIGRLRDVALDAGSLLLVGDRGSAWRWRQSGCERLDVGTQHDLHAVASCAGDATVITGDFGSVLRPARNADPSGKPALVHIEQSPWAVLDAVPGTETLWGIWGDGRGYLVAVGEAGTVLTFDNNRWKRCEVPFANRLQAVWGTNRHNVYAVGEGGAILHFDGTTWSRSSTPGIAETLVAVTGFGVHDVFAVGDGGVILRFDGVDWRRHSSGTNEALYDIWGVDGNHVIAVGDAGVVVRWNGTRWDSFQAGSDSALYGVWGTALDNIFLVGPSGTVVRFDGARWCPERVPLRTDLLAVAGASAGRPIAIGSLGSLARRDDEQWWAEDAACEQTLRGLWVAPDGVAYAVGDGGRVLRRDAHAATFSTPS